MSSGGVPSELEELQRTVVEVIDHLVVKLCKWKDDMILLSFEEIVQNENAVKCLINVKKNLDKFPSETSEVQFVPTSSHHNSSLVFAPATSHLHNVVLSPVGVHKLVTFRYSVEYTIWECSNKLALLKEFVMATDNFKKVLALAHSINTIKKLLSSSNVTLSISPEDKSMSKGKAVNFASAPQVITLDSQRSEDVVNETTQDHDVDHANVSSVNNNVFETELRPRKQILKKKEIPFVEEDVNTLKNITFRFKGKNLSNLQQEEDLLRAIESVSAGLDSALEVLKDTKFDTDAVVMRASQIDLDDVLLTIRILKEIRQYGGGTYEYPSVSDLKMGTQKINTLHELGQGKLLIVQELVKNTLIELRGNMLKFKKYCEEHGDFPHMLAFARLLRSVKRTLDKLQPASVLLALPTATSNKNVHDRLCKLQYLLKEEPKQDLITEEKTFLELHEKLSYSYITGHLLRYSIQHLDHAMKEIAHVSDFSHAKVPLMDDDVTKFLHDNSYNNPLGTKKELLEQMVNVLRQEPAYLTRLASLIPYQKLDEMVQLIAHSINSDLFLASEDILLLKLLKSLIDDCNFKNYKSAGEVIRANSLLTKLLSSYTKRMSSKAYLRIALHEPINSLLSLDEYTEMDPLQVYKKLFPDKNDVMDRDVALTRPEIAKVIQNVANDKQFGKGKETWLEPMNSFIQTTQGTIANYFNSVISVTDDLQACLGCLKHTPLPKIQRSIVISPKELYDLASTLRENEAKVMLSGDSLTRILNQLGNLNTTNEDKVLSLSRQPLLLKVPLHDEQLKFKRGFVDDIKENKLLVDTVKLKLRKLLVETETVFEENKKTDEPFIQLLNKLGQDYETQEQLVNKALAEDIVSDLKQLPDIYKANNFQRLFDELELEHWKRMRLYEALLMDKIELLQAIEQHNKEVTDLTEMKIMYYDYLEHTQNARSTDMPPFQDWVKRKREGRDSVILAYYA